MTETQRWLAEFPWDAVICDNKRLRLGRIADPEGAGFRRARSMWEEAQSQEISLKQALDLCRSCYTLGPLGRPDDNIFVSIGRALVKPMAQKMSPALGGTVTAVVSDYILGNAPLSELEQILKLIRFRYLTEA